VKFFFDHDVPADAARVLRQEGHDVVELRDVLPIDSTDRDVLMCARQQGRLLVTCNRDDFLHLVQIDGSPGLIVLIRRRTRQAECAHLLALIERAGDAGLAGNVNFA
jgi:predicted nuclease of predicted toxin-antitoxin system